MRLFGEYLKAEAKNCADRRSSLDVIGRRDRLPTSLLEAIEEAEFTTSDCSRMLLRIAVDYSARECTIMRAARAWGRYETEAGFGANSYAAFSLIMQAAMHSAIPAPDVDLLIRTGGEFASQRFCCGSAPMPSWFHTQDVARILRRRS